MSQSFALHAIACQAQLRRPFYARATPLYETHVPGTAPDVRIAPLADRQRRETTKLLGADVEAGPSGQSPPAIPAWVARSEKVKAEMSLVKERLAKLKEYHAKALMVSFDAEADSKSRTEALTREVQLSLKRMNGEVRALPSSVRPGDDATVVTQVRWPGTDAFCTLAAAVCRWALICDMDRQACTSTLANHGRAARCRASVGAFHVVILKRCAPHALNRRAFLRCPVPPQVQKQLSAALFKLTQEFRAEETRFLNRVERQKGLSAGSVGFLADDDLGGGTDPGFTEEQSMRLEQVRRLRGCSTCAGLLLFIECWPVASGPRSGPRTRSVPGCVAACFR